jgi:hypothetical protein
MLLFYFNVSNVSQFMALTILRNKSLTSLRLEKFGGGTDMLYRFMNGLFHHLVMGHIFVWFVKTNGLMHHHLFHQIWWMNSWYTVSSRIVRFLKPNTFSFTAAGKNVCLGKLIYKCDKKYVWHIIIYGDRKNATL